MYALACCKRFPPQLKLLSMCLLTTDVLLGLLTVSWTGSFFMGFDCKASLPCTLIHVVLGRTGWLVAMFTITEFALDRLLSLYLAMRYIKYVTRKSTINLCVLTWCLAFSLTGVSLIEDTKYISDCSIYNPQTLVGVGCEYVCIVIVIVCYVAIMKNVREHVRKIASLIPADGNKWARVHLFRSAFKIAVISLSFVSLTIHMRL